MTMRPETWRKFVAAAAAACAVSLWSAPSVLGDDPKAKADEKKADDKKTDDGSPKDGKSRRRAPDAKAIAERSEKLLKEHPEADKDKDGKLSPEEFRAWIRENPPVPTGDRLADVIKKYPEADKDKDGKLSQAEWNALVREHPDARTGGRGAGGTGGGPGGAGGGRPARLSDEEILKQHPDADKDKDGKLSAQERREFLRSQRKDSPRRGGKKDGAKETEKKGDV